MMLSDVPAQCPLRLGKAVSVAAVVFSVVAAALLPDAATLPQAVHDRINADAAISLFIMFPLETRALGALG